MRIAIETRNDFLLDDIKRKHLVSMYLASDEGQNRDAMLDFILYAEQRYTFTMLVSGGYRSGAATRGHLPVGAGESATVSTKIPSIDRGNGRVEGKAVKYRIRGRNRRAVTVLGTSTYGTATPASNVSGGFFSLILQTQEIRPTSVVQFPTGKLARVHGTPTRNQSGEGFVYTFQTFASESFEWTSWMGSGGGNRKVYAAYNTVGESSRRGYMSWLLPDTFINHTTTMRKGFNLSGDALIEEGVHKYTLLDANGKPGFTGFSWVRESIARGELALDLDNMAWDGRSTMRDAYGNLLDQPSQVDERGNPIWAGDGVKEQIRGENDVTASGTDGLPTWEDYNELFINARDRMSPGQTADLVFVTGPKGADHLASEYIKFNKANYNLQVVSNDKAGANVPYLFVRTLFVGGLTIYIVVDPRMGDKDRWSGRLPNGELYKEYEGYLMNFGSQNGRQNVRMEALKNQYVDREYVIGQFDGMTGRKGAKPMNPVDEVAFDVLVERIVTVEDPRTSGLLEINPGYILF